MLTHQRSSERLRQTVDDLHDTVQDIRATIFALRTTQATNDFRERVLDLVSGLTDQSGILTTVRLTGPLSIVDSDLAEQAEAVISEAVSNSVRHSGASSITVQIAVADEFVIDVTDDGVGIPSRCSAPQRLGQHGRAGASHGRQLSRSAELKAVVRASTGPRRWCRA